MKATEGVADQVEGQIFDCHRWLSRPKQPYQTETKPRRNGLEWLRNGCKYLGYLQPQAFDLFRSTLWLLRDNMGPIRRDVGLSEDEKEVLRSIFGSQADIGQADVSLALVNYLLRSTIGSHRP